MILIVDDEPLWVADYKAELELANFQVMIERRVDRALDFIKAHRKEIEAVILDIMMPPGVRLAEADTRRGLRTGIKVFEEIRQLAPALPVAILTNVTDEEVAGYFRTQSRCLFFRKEDISQRYLADEIKRFISMSRETQGTIP